MEQLRGEADWSLHVEGNCVSQCSFAFFSWLVSIPLTRDVSTRELYAVVAKIDLEHRYLRWCRQHMMGSIGTCSGRKHLSSILKTTMF